MRTARAPDRVASATPTRVRVDGTMMDAEAARGRAEAVPPDLAIEGDALRGFAGAFAPGRGHDTVGIADPLLDAEGCTLAPSFAPALPQAAGGSPALRAPLGTVDVAAESLVASDGMRSVDTIETSIPSSRCRGVAPVAGVGRRKTRRVCRRRRSKVAGAARRDKGNR
jgi:hypothetical protein